MQFSLSGTAQLFVVIIGLATGTAGLAGWGIFKHLLAVNKLNTNQAYRAIKKIPAGIKLF